MTDEQIEALALYFTGPCVGLHSVGLQMGGQSRVTAEAFFAARGAMGISGYVIKEHAVKILKGEM